MAETWQTRFGGAAFKADSMRTHGGHKADKPRGSGQSITRPAFFFSWRENPTINCLGKYPKEKKRNFTDSPQVFQPRARPHQWARWNESAWP